MDIDGIRISGYRDPRKLGSGASSSVYAAVQETTGVERAVKVLLRTTPDFRKRFTREKDALASLRHPGIVSIIDAGTAATGEPYLVTDYYDGGSLEDRLASARPAPFTPDEVASIGITMADALAYAHGAGWLHRDIKPANILVHGDQVALADFGIARGTDILAETGSLDLMTPHHAAPETVCVDERGELSPPSRSSDTYSLVSTLYTLLAGRPPFAMPAGRPDGIMPFLGRLANDPPPKIRRSDLGPAWEAFFATGLAKTPSERYPGPAAVADALRALRPDSPGGVDRPPTGTAASDGESTIDLSLDETIDVPRSATPPPTTADPTTADLTIGTQPLPGAPSAATLGETAAHGSERRQAMKPPDEAATSSGGQRFPTRVLIGVSVVVLALVVAAFALVGKDPADRSASTTTTLADQGATPAQVKALAPTGVVIHDDRVPVEVSWTDHTGGQYPTVVIAARAGESRATATPAQPGAVSVTLEGVEAGDALCVYAVAVLDATSRAPSKDWRCVNGAIPPTKAPE